MAVRVEIAEQLKAKLVIGVVEVVDVDVVAANDELRAFCDEVARTAAQQSQLPEWEQQCSEVRQMLRNGKFKASGRSKPAQEYLLRCATTDGALPAINGPVDLLNAVSLSCNLPISLLSVGKCSDNLLIDYGKASEQFIFNSVGHAIDLTDLITVYDRSVEPMRPVGTPIKDSMAGKIEPTDRHLIAIIYTPTSDRAKQRSLAAVERLAEGMKRFCGASQAVVITE
jgi:DNA/RNA-binding domain of Phe-tRNA-synthetase-like protein